MAARKRKIKLNENWREKIRVGVMIDRLHKDFMGKIELTDGQRKSGQIILAKIEPDLARTELTGKGGKDLVPAVVNVNFPVKKAGK